MKLKQVLLTALISGVTAISSVYLYSKWTQGKYSVDYSQNKLPVNYAGYGKPQDIPPGQYFDFQEPAAKAIPAVVHIKTKTNPKTVVNDNYQKRSNPFRDLFGDDEIFDQFFNPRSRTIPGQQASGSGVIITEDGYIVTNNHVIDNADEINVTLNNKKTYKAKLIATDPSTDIAVIKIEGKNFPYMLFGNSDNIKVGQWVLAVGYPLNLETTVTAGIVSAKSRTLDINSRQSNTPVESFIQTDAAVNQGNSGGALVSTTGELVGINSAIASPTGYYSGYSYAIPVNIVKKIVDDLIKYGNVQRAYLGISYPRESMSDEQKKELGVTDGEGVYVTDVLKEGAANEAGIKKGDVITKINNADITSAAELQEQLTRYKPGDKISVSFKRNGKTNTVSVTLKNKVGNTDLVKSSIIDNLGAEFEALSATKAKEYGVKGGIVVKSLSKEGMLSDQNPSMKNGFVIIKIGSTEVKTVDELIKALEKSGNSVNIEGFYPGYDGLYYYSLNDFKSGQ